MVCDDNDDIVLLLHCIYSMQAIDLLLRLDTGTRQWCVQVCENDWLSDWRDRMKEVPHEIPPVTDNRQLWDWDEYRPRSRLPVSQIFRS